LAQTPDRPQQFNAVDLAGTLRYGFNLCWVVRGGFRVVEGDADLEEVSGFA
jgi:hypothetical protein